MLARRARSLFMVLATMLFALHGQAMANARPVFQVHAAADQSHRAHEDGRCKIGCCATTACCGQVVEAEVLAAYERRSPAFEIISHRAVTVADVGPPDPPPRSPLVLHGNRQHD